LQRHLNGLWRLGKPPFGRHEAVNASFTLLAMGSSIEKWATLPRLS
jgi:hypothetical protein